jgi:dienelactone hydrolase
VLGISRGGECALLLGTVYPELIHGVVSYVGSSLVWGTRYTVHGPHDQQEPSWTLGGKPVPFATGFEDARSVIQVEKIAGPLFVVGAIEDSLWPSALFANNIVSRLKQHRRTDYTALVYAKAGHAVGYIIPNIPVIVDLGGTRAADARGRGDSWPKLLAFLARLR